MRTHVNIVFDTNTLLAHTYSLPLKPYVMLAKRMLVLVVTAAVPLLRKLKPFKVIVNEAGIDETGDMTTTLGEMVERDGIITYEKESTLTELVLVMVLSFLFLV